MRGKFITLEGLDGAGKSTHLDWLARFLAGRGIAARVTREPGGTALGERLRELVLHAEVPLHPETETLLIFAARREHLDKVIAPALAQGAWVLCDRFTDATYAYQSGGSGVSWEQVAALERWTQRGLEPDLTLLFDLAPRTACLRVARDKAPDRFEREQGDFHERVRQAYLRRAREAPHRVRVIDASAAIPEIHKVLEDILSILCSNETI
jgi:dTMP kinase